MWNVEVFLKLLGLALAVPTTLAASLKGKSKPGMTMVGPKQENWWKEHLVVDPARKGGKTNWREEILRLYPLPGESPLMRYMHENRRSIRLCTGLPPSYFRHLNGRTARFVTKG